MLVQAIFALATVSATVVLHVVGTAWWLLRLTWTAWGSSQ